MEENYNQTNITPGYVNNPNNENMPQSGHVNNPNDGMNQNFLQHAPIRLSKQQKRIQAKELKRINKEQKKLLKPKKDFNILWKITTGLFGFSTLGLLGGMLFKNGQYTWIGATFTFLMISVLLFIFLIYLSKKTHAIMEFKAMMSGKPISLFFTDTKRLEWRVIEPEGNVLIDKYYGAFLVNEKGSYVDKKTKNIFLAFNPSIATNASVESFKITDTLVSVLKDEKQLSHIRHALMSGTMDVNDVVFKDSSGEDQRLTGFKRITENVDFSHLKSLLNTLIPHAINSKIEMTVQQRLGGLGKINYAQAILIIVAVIGSVTIAIMLLKVYGGGGGTTTVVKETIKYVAQNASSVVTG